MTRKTTAAWWNAIKQDPALLEDWLEKQLRGERTAVGRLEAFCEAFVPPDHRWHRTLRIIQAQEQQHAAWILRLLDDRGFSTELRGDPQRYWESTLPAVRSPESAAAASAYAESMRLERIRLIAGDPGAPTDIGEAFRRILPQEIFHARAFREMAGEDAMAELLAAHEQGLEAIGLIPSGPGW
jgi:rubrerythrin